MRRFYTLMHVAMVCVCSKTVTVNMVPSFTKSFTLKMKFSIIEMDLIRSRYRPINRNGWSFKVYHVIPYGLNNKCWLENSITESCHFCPYFRFWIPRYIFHMQWVVLVCVNFLFAIKVFCQIISESED